MICPCRRLLIAVGLLLAAVALAAEEPAGSGADPGYLALRAARPQGETYAVRDVTLERDAFRFRLEAGDLQFLSAVEGRVFGAVFSGAGSWELIPATEGERRHLEFLTGGKDLARLSDRFESLVVLFTDDTEAELRKRIGTSETNAGQTADGALARSFEEALTKTRKDSGCNLHLRLLQDLRNGPIGGGVFIGLVDGIRLPPSLAALDPGGFELLGVTGGLLGGAETGLWVRDEGGGSLWYLSHRVAEVPSGAAHPPRRLADALHYRIDTTILRNTGIRGSTSIRLRAEIPGLRLVPLQLLSQLRISRAEWATAGDDAAWHEVPFLQSDLTESNDAAVVLPRPPTAGEVFQIRLTYEGSDVLRDAGGGNFAVGARTSWYPNLGVWTDLATFELTYRVPRTNDVISVGSRIDNRVEGDLRVALWKAEHPIRVAGFNFGKFKKLERLDEQSGIRVEVYTNPGTPDVIKEINHLLRAASKRPTEVGSPIPADLENPYLPPPVYSGPQAVEVSTERLADSAIADGINAARVLSIHFGKLPAGTVSITQQAQWSFGQSWPSLIFLPYLAFLDSTSRQQLGLQGLGAFVESVGHHEFAHQWWGHEVGFSSYQDQWLSEGLAEFSAALVLQFTEGVRRYNDFWERARQRILEKPQLAAVPNDAAGPLTLGWRLDSSRNWDAYTAMVYDKGAYILQMLRMMMREPGTPAPDASFVALLKDFASTYAGREASTRDFQRVVERHMVPTLNATGDGKMDWFFDQWVHGTEIPRYRSKVAIESAGDGRYRLVGSVSQEGVSASFLALLPMYADLGDDKIVRIGVVPMKGLSTVPIDVTMPFPKKPKRILFNALHEVLARD